MLICVLISRSCSHTMKICCESALSEGSGERSFIQNKKYITLRRCNRIFDGSSHFFSLQAILMSPYNDDAALRRQAALTRVRQRRAQRVLGTGSPSDPVEEATDPVAEPKVPKSFARTAPAVMMPEVNPVTWR